MKLISISSLNLTKIHTRRLVSVVAVAGIALAHPLMAAKGPSEDMDTNQLKTKENQADQVAKEAPKPKQKNAFLGLGGAPVSKTLSLHLKLNQGEGLTLFHIIPDSAAAKAGLRPHDIMTSFDGKLIGSQQDLRNAIAGCKPGDQVSIQFINKGTLKKKKVTLGERPERIKNMHGRQGINPRWMFKGLGAQVPEADRKRMEQQIKEHVERLQKQINGAGCVEIPLKGRVAPQGKMIELGFQMNAATSVTMSDGEGSIILMSRNDKKEIVVKDKEDEIVFEGPYNTPQDKAALPDDISKRVKNLNLENNIIELRINPAQAAPLPEAHEDDHAQ